MERDFKTISARSLQARHEWSRFDKELVITDFLKDVENSIETDLDNSAIKLIYKTLLKEIVSACKSDSQINKSLVNRLFKAM
jgi:uncharacterized protein YktA (UPF0223 family)